MNLPDLIETWGYWAIFGGSLLEGETLLLLGGFAAHRGYLSLPLVIGAAALGGFLGDQVYFLLGRRYGEGLLARFPRMRPRAARMRALLERYHAPVIVGVRFLYGLRTVGPMAIGMTSVPWVRFLALNFLGAVLWALAITLAGYAFGQAFELVLGNLRRYEEILITALALAGIAVWWWRRRRERARQ